MQRPEYTDDQKWWLVDGTSGAKVYEEHAYTMEEALLEYPGVPLGLPVVICGVGVRLVNPKHDWQEPWHDVFPSLEDAKAFVRSHWGMDPETGYSCEWDSHPQELSL
ncbi:MAG: hypothetical protein GTO63_21470 [Anaerolineae bacterium]|nr:hypothetical protein [Anaerolineae bacterium]NIQ80276.1 hypothetical protein [Anaerolineae bacterium]